jgi:hypothetical protein
VRLNFRQDLASNLHFRQFNGAKTGNRRQGEAAKSLVLIELAASNYFHSRQGIASSHSCCDLNHKFAATEGLWFQFMNVKLMIPISVQHMEASLPS